MELIIEADAVEPVFQVMASALYLILLALSMNTKLLPYVIALILSLDPLVLDVHAVAFVLVYKAPLDNPAANVELP